MGCDIHCHVEKRGSTGSWQKIGGFVSDHYDPNNEFFSGDQYRNSDSPIEARNYFLFSILAGVRSDGKSIKPISEPKGLPDDASAEVKADSDEWGGDGHSHSWLTVKDLMEGMQGGFDCEGVVSINEYREFKENGAPSSWSGSVGGGPVSCCTNSHMDNLLEWGWHLDPAMKDTVAHNYTVVRWKIKAEDALSLFIKGALPQLVDRCEREDKSDVRIVFWFDN